ALLAGPAGVGKTLVVRTLREQLGDRLGKIADLAFPLMSDREMLYYVAERLGAPPAESADRSVAESLSRLEHVLAANHAEGKLALLVVDEAHLLEDSGLLEPLR